MSPQVWYIKFEWFPIFFSWKILIELLCLNLHGKVIYRFCSLLFEHLKPITFVICTQIHPCFHRLRLWCDIYILHASLTCVSVAFTWYRWTNQERSCANILHSLRPPPNSLLQNEVCRTRMMFAGSAVAMDAVNCK